ASRLLVTWLTPVRLPEGLWSCAGVNAARRLLEGDARSAGLEMLGGVGAPVVGAVNRFRAHSSWSPRLVGDLDGLQYLDAFDERLQDKLQGLAVDIGRTVAQSMAAVFGCPRSIPTRTYGYISLEIAP